MATNKATIKGGDLTPGIRFIDPRRDGGRPAVVRYLGRRTDTVQHVVLDDDTPWGPWPASYRLDEELELA